MWLLLFYHFLRLRSLRFVSLRNVSDRRPHLFSSLRINSARPAESLRTSNFPFQPLHRLSHHARHVVSTSSWRRTSGITLSGSGIPTQRLACGRFVLFCLAFSHFPSFPVLSWVRGRQPPTVLSRSPAADNFPALAFRGFSGSSRPSTIFAWLPHCVEVS